MTFIASVIAKKGVAIVADSFGTSLEHSMIWGDFVSYLTKKPKIPDSVPLKELGSLFESRPSATRNYVDKLVKFDLHSAVTTAGDGRINKKETASLIKEISETLTANPAYETFTIEQKLNGFCDLLKQEVIAQVATTSIGSTDFIFSHYNKALNKPQVFLIKVKASDKRIIDPAEVDIVKFEERTHLRIITDGQDTFVDRLIFGSLYKKCGQLYGEILKETNKIIKPQKAKKTALVNLFRDPNFLSAKIREDVFSVNFRELSLQEAVDLATLLIKIEMDIQVYTEKIPTVGGLIRLAVINEDGFRWVSGNEIVKPKIL